MQGIYRYKLFHADAWDDHKYVARVPLPRKPGQKSNSYRYFYTRAAYQAYLNGQKTGQPQVGPKFQNANVPKVSLPLTGTNTSKPMSYLSKGNTQSTTDEKTASEKAEEFAKYNFKFTTSLFGINKAGRDWLDNAGAYSKSVAESTEYMEAIKDAVNKITKNPKDYYENLSTSKNSIDSINNFAMDMTSLMGEYAWNVRNHELKVDNQKRFMENVYSDDPIANFDKLDSPGDPDEALSVINSNYDGDSSVDWDGDGSPGSYAWTCNCSYCTAAYDMRRRGYDVVADGIVEGDDLTTNQELASWYDGAEIKNWQDAVKFDSSGNATYDDVEKGIEDELKSHGEGARGFFTVSWLGGGGHAVAWEVEHGEVVIRDCQTGEKHDVRYFVDRADFQSEEAISWFRTDNIEPNREIANIVKNRKRG